MITLNGHSIWALEPKKGPTVLLLHGGMSSSTSLIDTLGPSLKKSYRIAAFDRRGHGKSPDNDQPFHYEEMASDAIAYLEHLGRRAHLVGHSDGAIVALLVALRRPDVVKRVVAVGANFNFRGLLPTPRFTTSSPGFAEWAAKYAAESPDGLEHAGVVAAKAQRLFAHEPTLRPRDLKTITRPVLIMAGDDDVASLEHTCTMYESIPNAQLAIIPGASHAVLKEHTKLCASMILHFLKSDLPPDTRAPMRRSSEQRVD